MKITAEGKASSWILAAVTALAVTVDPPVILVSLMVSFSITGLDCDTYLGSFDVIVLNFVFRFTVRVICPVEVNFFRLTEVCEKLGKIIVWEPFLIGHDDQI